LTSKDKKKIKDKKNYNQKQLKRSKISQEISYREDKKNKKNFSSWNNKDNNAWPNNDSKNKNKNNNKNNNNNNKINNN
jgi:hypothetical protein